MASASSTSPRVSVRGSFERSDDDYFPLTQSYLFFGFVIKVLRVPGVMASVDDFFHASETSVRGDSSHDEASSHFFVVLGASHQDRLYRTVKVVQQTQRMEGCGIPIPADTIRPTTDDIL
jgi:hypothetical protein